MKRENKPPYQRRNLGIYSDYKSDIKNDIKNKKHKLEDINPKSNVRNINYHRNEENNKDYDKTTISRRKLKERKVKLNPNKNQFIFSFIILTSVIMIALLGTLMYRYSLISELKYDINTISRNLDEISNQKKEIKVKLEQLNRSDIIEKIAIEQLGMQYPTDEQIVYIEID